MTLGFEDSETLRSRINSSSASLSLSKGVATHQPAMVTTMLPIFSSKSDCREQSVASQTPYQSEQALTLRLKSALARKSRPVSSVEVESIFQAHKRARRGRGKCAVT